MISLELLEELVAFDQYGTLSATADHLMITQPSVTRGMKKLEQELGVTLFDRKVNRISLTETGKLAAAEAKKLLDAENNFTEKIINFDQMQNSINIGSVVPGPLLWTEIHQDKFEQNLKFNSQLVPENRVSTDLEAYKERLIFTTQDSNDDNIESMFIGTENLYVRINKFHPLAAYKSVTFKDLAGLSFIVATDIGPWKKVIEDNIPNAKFLYQEDLNALDELTHYSNFPTFRSNLTIGNKIHEEDNDDRISIPIVDDTNANKIEIYGSYLKDQQKIIQPFLKGLAQKWPQDSTVQK